MRKNDGGSAFPSGDIPGYDEWEYGMTLRQWYAGMVAQGLASATDKAGMWTGDDPYSVAKAAFRIADAMIATEQEDKS